VPHLAERQRIYSFPNPWRIQYYGVEGTKKPDPARIEWLILDETVLGSEQDIALVECIKAAGTFTEAFRDQQIVVYHRIATADPVDRSCT
jgi:hypothetical protein